jgi:hypothetical protein
MDYFHHIYTVARFGPLIRPGKCIRGLHSMQNAAP